MYGLTNEQLSYLKRFVVEPLVNEGARVWLFGSRARGDQKVFSDIDLMVESERDLRSTISAIQEVLTNSDLPFKVDLVQDRDFATSYRAGYLRDRVELELT